MTEEGRINMSVSSDENPVITRTAEPKPSWWSSLAAQLTGRSVERTVEQVTTTSEEAPPAETELAELEVIEHVLEHVPAVDSEVVDRHAPPAHDPDLIAAGRAWIGECVWLDMEPDYVAELTDDEVISGIARHYDGGVRAFEESGYDIVDEPLPFDVDENGFPTDHRTFQSQTLPDDTHSWVCGKAGCYNSAPDYATPDESLAAAQEHEISHGYDRELEVAVPVAVAGLDEPKPDVESLGGAVTIEDLDLKEYAEPDDGVIIEEPTEGLDAPSKEIKAHIVIGGRAMCSGERAPWNAPEIDPTEDQKCPGCVAWDVDVSHQEALEQLLAVEDGVTIEELDDGVRKLPKVAEPEPVLTDTQQKAVEWVDTLESGRVIQAHGVWEGRTVLGQKTKCTVQAGADELGVEVHDMREIFGDDLIDDCLHRNDGERQSFDKIAKEIRKDQGLEMER